MMQRKPGRTGGAVGEAIEQRRVRHRVGVVLHCLSLTVGARYRARVEMIAADHDWRLEFAVRHHLIEGKADAVAIAKTELRRRIERHPLCSIRILCLSK